MIVQIALCDDEPEELDKMAKILSAYGRRYNNLNIRVQFFENADTLLYMIREREYLPDLIFMDIYMPGKTGEMVPLGMEAAKQLRDMGNRAKLVFLTTSREHALGAFDVEASQYLLKPVQVDRLFSFLDRFREETEEEQERYILLRMEGMHKRVALNDIAYCEAQGKRQCIYLADGAEILQNLTMARIYEMCSACRKFVKVGVSYIINLDHVDSLNAQEALLDNGCRIYLPRGTYRSLREQYFDYYCGEE